MALLENTTGAEIFLLEQDNGITSRVYLITENGMASLQYDVKPGDVLHKEIEILVEIPTYYGNTMVKKYSYHLRASNMK